MQAHTIMGPCVYDVSFMVIRLIDDTQAFCLQCQASQLYTYFIYEEGEKLKLCCSALWGRVI
jgi:hypothetical protein